jgi:hypothetical protein
MNIYFKYLPRSLVDGAKFMISKEWIKGRLKAAYKLYERKHTIHFCVSVISYRCFWQDMELK